MTPSIFEQAEAWEASADTLFPVGSHVGTIREPAIDINRNGNPEITLRVENGSHSMSAWLPYSMKALGKVAQLFDAAGAERPRDGEFDPQTLKLSEECVRRLDGRKTGIVVREQPSNKDPSKMFRTIEGFLPPSQITDELPADTRGLAASSSGRVAADDDIPF